jgi:hypothetical protein
LRLDLRFQSLPGFDGLISGILADHQPDVITNFLPIVNQAAGLAAVHNNSPLLISGLR